MRQQDSGDRRGLGDEGFDQRREVGDASNGGEKQGVAEYGRSQGSSDMSLLITLSRQSQPSVASELFWTGLQLSVSAEHVCGDSLPLTLHKRSNALHVPTAVERGGSDMLEEESTGGDSCLVCRCVDSMAGDKSAGESTMGSSLSQLLNHVNDDMWAVEEGSTRTRMAPPKTQLNQLVMLV